LIGSGRIGARLTEDVIHKSRYPYPTHADVLSTHPSFEFEAVVDTNFEAREFARDKWKLKEAVSSISELTTKETIEVAVLATGGAFRPDLGNYFPNLKVVLVEKPLAADFQLAKAFVERLDDLGIGVVVNFPRRYGSVFRRLAEGELENEIGRPCAVFGVYGNGLKNNGSHLVDLIRTQIGEIESVRALTEWNKCLFENNDNDPTIPFYCRTIGDVGVVVNILSFDNYREVGLDVWGTKGRLQMLNETLTFVWSKTIPSNQLSGAREIDFGKSHLEVREQDKSLFDVYERVALLATKSIPGEDGREGLVTTKAIESIVKSAKNGCVSINPLDP